MPITEIVRVIASADGAVDGRAARVDLVVDTDGTMGTDGAAIGFPAFWLRVGDRTVGPFRHEDEAVDAAADRFGATFY